MLVGVDAEVLVEDPVPVAVLCALRLTVERALLEVEVVLFALLVAVESALLVSVPEAVAVGEAVLVGTTATPSMLNPYTPEFAAHGENLKMQGSVHGVALPSTGHVHVPLLEAVKPHFREEVAPLITSA